MTWQAATFAGLALVLVGGFWWYERTRPSARLVALVAALAALAIAGRLVLAPIPNVVATTDIALLTGYALGAGPGFAVGALAAPVSNIWLGQGPWTAWEMAGWGMVGLGGAWIGSLTGGRLGRLGLAIACALAGFAYGALLDLSVMVTYGGEQSLDRYLALSARGIPFNVAHATGNFVIALAAGPALVRMISRFRTRSVFTWRPAAAVPAALIALVAASALTTPPPADARRSTLAWLVGTQNSDGGFAAAPGQPSSPAMTGWVMLGLEAVGRNPLDVRSEGDSPVSYLRSQADRLRSVGDLERTILALVGAGLDPHRFAGTDLVAELRERRDGDGSVEGQVNLTAFYALAIRAADGDAGSLGKTGRWLLRAQNDDGGWGIQPRAPSESDSTGAALQGLVASRSRGSALRRGVAWLRRAQGRDGAWALGSAGVDNTQSTAWAVQGLAAAGSGGDEIDRGLGYLGRRRAADGHYRYSATSDQTPVWVTAQALLAVRRQPFPLRAVERAPRRSSSQGGSRSGTDESAAGGSVGAGGSADPATIGPADASPESPGSPGGDGRGGAVPQATDPAPSSDAAAPEARGGSGGALASPSAAPGPVPVNVSYAGAEEGGDRGTAYLLGGLALLGAVVGGGLVWYRRRPS